MYFMVLFAISFFCSECLFAKVETYCHEKTRLIGSDEIDMYKLVVAKFLQTVKLECNFCEETDDTVSKLWYWQDVLLEKASVEVQLDMEINPRIHVMPDHTLVLHNITPGDAGLYHCLKYRFLLDVVDRSVDPTVGTLSDWLLYHSSALLPVNKRLQHMEYEVQLSVITDWEAWGPCVTWNRPKGERRRLGRCRLRPNSQKNSSRGFGSEAEKQQVIKKVFELSCHSVVLAKLYPNISAAVRMVPEFIHAEACIGDRRTPENRIGYNSKQSHYKRQYLLDKGAHITLVCPEATLEDVVTWLKDGELIMPNAMKGDPHIMVDTFSMLYLVEVTQANEGNYTCFVGNTYMLEVMVYVTSQTQSAREEYVRHMGYLGFVVSLCFIFYCAGIYVAFRLQNLFLNHNYTL